MANPLLVPTLPDVPASSRMRKAGLIFNPACGHRQKDREREVNEMAEIFREAGIAVVLCPTPGPGLASESALEMIQQECDTIIACGGDGTLNEILQGVVASGRDIRLSVVPFGSGNLLAKELGISSVPRTAARELLTAVPESAAICEISCVSSAGLPIRRYWIAASGIGADARVICNIKSASKAKFGIYAYYFESMRQLLLSGEAFPFFEVEFIDPRNNQPRRESVTQAVVSRIAYFAKPLRSRGEGSLGADEMELILFKTSRRSTYLAYGLALLLSQITSRPRVIRDVEVVRVRELSCFVPGADAARILPGSEGDSLLAEVDGELVGRLPVRISIIPHALTLLRPA